jgi:squalene cyclase
MALVTIQPLLVILKIKTVKDIGWYNDKNPPEDGSTANS